MAKQAKQACHYTRQGRQIFRNGKPYITVQRDDPYQAGDPSPHHVDVLAEQVTRWLNKQGCLRVRASTSSVKWAKTLDGVRLFR